MQAIFASKREFHAKRKALVNEGYVIHDASPVCYLFVKIKNIFYSIMELHSKDFSSKKIIITSDGNLFQMDTLLLIQMVL